MLHLPEMAKQGQQSTVLTLDGRLPGFLIPPCNVTVDYYVEAEDDFYLLNLHVRGDLNITCQRCMQPFHLPYDNKTIIAVCRSDERAEKVLERYECIVSANWHVELEELIIDELHLYVPQFHPEISDCGSEINQFLVGKIESY